MTVEGHWRWVGLPLIGALAIAGSVAAEAAVDGPKLSWNLAASGNSRPGTAALDKLAELVAAETGGKFTIKVAYGETLAASKEVIDGLKINAFEAGYWTPPLAPGKQPATSVFTLPFLPFGDIKNATRVADIYYRHPAVKRDFDAWDSIYLMPVTLPSYEFMGRGDPPLTLADWKGKRVRALGGQGQAMAMLGAVTTTVTTTEIYGAMERGVIDAAGLPNYAFASFKIMEIAKWHTTGLELGIVVPNAALSAKAFAALPAQYKTVLTGAVPAALDAQVTALVEDEAKSLAAFKARGLREVVIPAAMREEFMRMAGRPVWDDWVKEMNGKGYPGQELLDVILNESKKNRPS